MRLRAIHTYLFGSWLALLAGFSFPGCGSSQRADGGWPEDASLGSGGTTAATTGTGGESAPGGTTAVVGGMSGTGVSAGGASTFAGAVAGQSAAGGQASASPGGVTAAGGSTLAPLGGGAHGGSSTVMAGKTAPGGSSPGTGGAVSGGRSGQAGSNGTGMAGNSGAGGLGGAGGSAPSGGTTATGGTSASGGTSSTGGTTSTGGSTGGGGEYGFTYRSPGSKSITCAGEIGTQTMDEPDEDWLCTFHHGNRADYVYIRASATGECLPGLYVPQYRLELAEISMDGAVTSLANAKYDYGGNHHNDAVSFDFEGRTHKYDHSSLGYGGRRCQPMDCMVVYAAGSATVVETDGCTSARTLPEVCVAIKANRTHGALTPDPFKRCPGDPSP